MANVTVKLGSIITAAELKNSGINTSFSQHENGPVKLTYRDTFIFMSAN